MDITWILMASSSKLGHENICHRQSIGMYFLILAHVEVFSELSAGWTPYLLAFMPKTTVHNITSTTAYTIIRKQV